MKKYPISFRLTKTAQQLIDHLSGKLGLSKTGVIELSVRRLAEKEGLYQEWEKENQKKRKEQES